MPVLPPPVDMIKLPDGSVKYECSACKGAPHDWKKGEVCPKKS